MLSQQELLKMMDNPVMKDSLGFAMNPPLAFAKGILSKEWKYDACQMKDLY